MTVEPVHLVTNPTDDWGDRVLIRGSVAPPGQRVRFRAVGTVKGDPHEWGTVTDISTSRGVWVEPDSPRGEWTPYYRPSNGTMGEIFQNKYCDNCTGDHQAHIGNMEDGCPILAMAMMEPQIEWETRPDDNAAVKPRCVEFEPCAPCSEARTKKHEKVWPTDPGTAWKPPPQPPAIDGQLSLLE